jgi:phosphoribosyl 1,2-cyclic phosphodiesterase
MKLKVLGSGSKGNCYILQGDKETLLLECGLPWKGILKGLDFNIGDVSGCLVSHEHKDHSKAVVDLMKNGIDVYASQGTIEGLKIGNWAVKSYRLDFLIGERQKRIKDFITLPFTVEHDADEPLGFLIQHPEMGKLIYITDTYYCKYRFNGLQHIMIECNYSKEILDEKLYEGYMPPALRDRIVQSHMSLETCKEFLQANDLSQVRDITLIHLSDGNSDAEQFKLEIEGLTGKPVYIAEAGLEIEL